MAVKKNEPVLSPKAQGTALFLEFTRNSGTQQMIIISESEVEGQYRPPAIMMRQISEESKRRPWDVRIPSESKESDPAKRQAAYLEFYSKWFQTCFGSGNWVQKPNPFSVEVTAADIIDLGNGAAPQALVKRVASISKIREEEGDE